MMLESTKGALKGALLVIGSIVFLSGLTFVLVSAKDSRQLILETHSVRGRAMVERIGDGLPNGLYRVEYDGRIYLVYDSKYSAAIIEHGPVAQED